MPGETRQGQYDPVTPSRGGIPPGWIVSCLDCQFSSDEHGETAEAAIQQVAPRHDATHKLIARSVDYTLHPLYT